MKPAFSVQSTAALELLGFCPLCENGKIAPLFDVVQVWKCPECGLIFRNPQPSEDALDHFYRECFSNERIAAGTTDMAGTTPASARRYIHCLSKSIELRGKRVLDFGAGLGILSTVLRQHGADVVAIEPFAWRQCRQAGIETYRSPDELPEGIQFDAVVSLQVIEHLRRPWKTLAQLGNLLHPNGWLYVATPNGRGLSARIHGENWREILRPGHLIFFAPSTLERALEKAGFHHCARLKWFVRYADNPAKMLAHFLLQLFAQDGDLKYIAQKRP